MKNFISQFKAFAPARNVMDMVVGVLIGARFPSIVTSLTDNFINPILQFIPGPPPIPGRRLPVCVGVFIRRGQLFIMALILFCLMRAMSRLLAVGPQRRKPPPPPNPARFAVRDPLAAVRLPALHLGVGRARTGHRASSFFPAKKKQPFSGCFFLIPAHAFTGASVWAHPPKFLHASERIWLCPYAPATWWIYGPRRSFPPSLPSSPHSSQT